MEMISPEYYIERLNNYSIEELYKEKEKLEEEIKELEKTLRHPEDDPFFLQFASQDNLTTQLNMDKKYLIALNEFINTKKKDDDQ